MANDERNTAPRALARNEYVICVVLLVSIVGLFLGISKQTDSFALLVGFNCFTCLFGYGLSVLLCDCTHDEHPARMT